MEEGIISFVHADTVLPCNWDVKVKEGLEKFTAVAFTFGMKDVWMVGGGVWVEMCVFLRCLFFNLPYGDQTLSLGVEEFRFLGGFPDQCIMEDYVLVDLLRHRSALGFRGLKVLKEKR